MQRFPIILSLMAAPIAIAVALLATGVSAEHPTWWSASVALAILGGVAIMIYGINIHSVPIHAQRTWKFPSLVAAQVGAGISGAWLVFFGRGYDIDAIERAGHFLAAAGAVLFLTNLKLLFRQPGPPRPPKTPKSEWSNQKRVDRLAIPFTIFSGPMAIAGTILGLVLTFWTPDTGRWDLVWAHVLLLGFFFPMASGTSYHTLARWSGATWRWIPLVRVHLFAFLVGFPLMITALAFDLAWMFLIAGPLMAIAMLAWAGNVLPMAMRLGGPVRLGIVLALAFLTIGVGLGVMFAIDPATGPRLRGTHMAANMFGFAGLLISGFGYAYLPRLSGRDGLRWPAMAMVQITVLVTGVIGGMISLGLRMYGEAGSTPVLVTCFIAAIGMLLFAMQVAGNFWQGEREPSHATTPTVGAGSAS